MRLKKFLLGLYFRVLTVIPCQVPERVGRKPFAYDATQPKREARRGLPRPS